MPGIFGFSFRQTIAQTGLLDGFTDWHCHILPGVDDGVRSMDDALSILDCYGRLGISEVWLTPHIMEDRPNTTDHLKEAFSLLRDRYHGRLRLYLAAEYMMDSLFESRLSSGDLLPLGCAGNHLLVETSYFNPPARFVSIMKNIKAAGFFPVLAHPERYIYMDMKDYDALIDNGIRLQLNLPSLIGAYGREVQRKAFRLLERGAYELAGTDLHRPSQTEQLRSYRCLPYRLRKSLTPDTFITI